MRWLAIETGALAMLLIAPSISSGAQNTTECSQSLVSEAIKQQRFELEQLKRELLRQSELIDNLTARLSERQQEAPDEQDENQDQDQEPQLGPMPFIPTGSPLMSIVQPICHLSESAPSTVSHSGLKCKKPRRALHTLPGPK